MVSLPFSGPRSFSPVAEDNPADITKQGILDMLGIESTAEIEKLHTDYQALSPEDSIEAPLSVWCWDSGHLSLIVRNNTREMSVSLDFPNGTNNGRIREIEITAHSRAKVTSKQLALTKGAISQAGSVIRDAISHHNASGEDAVKMRASICKKLETIEDLPKRPSALRRIMGSFRRDGSKSGPDTPRT